MANAAESRCRLCLVTPPDYLLDSIASLVSDALSGGDVASLIVTAPGGDATRLQAAATAIVPVAAARGVATLIHNDLRVAARTKADGVHIDTGATDIADAVAALRNRQIVGAGNIPTRHDALEIGEAEPDYLFFGRLDGDRDEHIFPKALELAAWWSSVTIIPAVVMGGRSIASVDDAAAEGIGFVALSAAVWDDPRGPSAAVAEAAERLARVAVAEAVA
jgi:thiamine-phosphate pyrophosphorylase